MARRAEAGEVAQEEEAVAPATSAAGRCDQVNTFVPIHSDGVDLFRGHFGLVQANVRFGLRRCSLPPAPCISSMRIYARLWRSRRPGVNSGAALSTVEV